MTTANRSSLSRAARQGHRWVGGLFLIVVAANFAALLLNDPPEAIVYLPLLPLVLLMISGIYLLALPHQKGTPTHP